MSLCVIQAHSQIAGILTSSIAKTSDTVIDAGTKYLGLKIGGSYNYCSVALKATNISGTTALTVTLEHSTDGVIYYSVPSDSVLTYSAAGTQGIIWTGYRDVYLRLKCVGSGTQHTRVQGVFSFR